MATANASNDHQHLFLQHHSCLNFSKKQKKTICHYHFAIIAATITINTISVCFCYNNYRSYDYTIDVAITTTTTNKVYVSRKEEK